MKSEGNEARPAAPSAATLLLGVGIADQRAVIELCMEAERVADPTVLARLAVEIGRLRRQAESSGDLRIAGFLEACAMRIAVVRDQAFLEAAEHAAQADRDRVDETVLAFIQENRGATITDVADRTGLGLAAVAVSIARLKASGVLPG